MNKTVTFDANGTADGYLAGQYDGSWEDEESGVSWSGEWVKVPYAASSSSNNLKTQTTNNANSSWKITIANGVASIVARGTYTRNVMQYNPNNGSPLFACYSSASQKALSLYMLNCSHKNVVDVEAKAATCTETGHEAGKQCTDCGVFVEGGAENAALGHSWNDATCTTPMTCSVCSVTEGNSDPDAHSADSGTCEYCGQEISSGPVETEATITFNDKSKRTIYNTSQQVWEENGITVTNNKAASSSNVGDYANPVRFYASSEVIIEMGEYDIAEIVFTCQSTSYATALKNSIGTVSGASVSVSGSTVTVTFTSVVSIFTIAKLTAQVQVKSITVIGKSK